MDLQSGEMTGSNGKSQKAEIELPRVWAGDGPS